MTALSYQAMIDLATLALALRTLPSRLPPW